MRQRPISNGWVFAAAAISALLAAAVTFAVLNHRRGVTLRDAIRAEESRAETAIAKARRDANQANRAREQAEELVDFILDDLRAGLLPLGRTELLSSSGERALAYFETLPPEQISPETEFNRGKLLVNIGQALTDQGDFTDAAGRFRTAIALFRQLTANDEENEDFRFELGWTLSEFGILLDKTRDHEEAEEVNREALAVFEQLEEAQPGQADYIYGLAAARFGLASSAAGLGRTEVALDEYRQCVVASRRALEIEPGHILSMQTLAIALNDAGLAHLRNDDYERAIPLHQEGCDEMRKLMARDPESRRWEKELATGLNNIGIALDALGRHGEATGYLREALALRQGLVAWDSRNGAWLLNLANSWHNLAALHFDLNEDEAAAEAVRESLAAYSRLIRLEPGNPAWRADLEDSHRRLARVLNENRGVEAVRDFYRDLVREVKTLLDRDRDFLSWESHLVNLHRDRAEAERGAGVSAEACLPILRDAVRLRRDSFVRHPESRGARHRLGVALARLALAARRAGDGELELQGFAAAHYLIDSAHRLGEGDPDRPNRPNRSRQTALRDHALALAGPSLVQIIPAGSNWKYFDQAAPSDNWESPGFEDADWPAGPAPLGYGNGGESTVIGFGGDDYNKHITSWFRGRFQLVERPGEGREVHLGVVCDDGAIVYLNGEEIARLGMPEGEITPLTLATDHAREPDENDFRTRALRSESLPWRVGENVVAVEVHQDDPGSSDHRFDLEIMLDFPVPKPLEGFRASVARRQLGDLIPKSIYLEIERSLESGSQPEL